MPANRPARHERKDDSDGLQAENRQCGLLRQRHRAHRSVLQPDAQPRFGTAGGAEPFWLQGTLAGGLDLIFFQMPARRGDSPAIVFTVDDGGIDDIVSALADKGVTIVTPVSEAPGGWSADFLDPDGFALGLWQSGELPRTRKA